MAQRQPGTRRRRSAINTQKLHASGSDKASLLRRHLQQKPDDGEAWMALARALLEQAPGPELSHAIGQCLRFLPDNHLAWILAAAVQQRTRGSEAALQWLQQAAERAPERAAPYLALAQLRLKRTQLVEALAAADRAVEVSGGRPETLGVRGDINLRGAHWNEALADYRRVEESGTKDAGLIARIGRCYLGLENHEAAEAHLLEALARDPRLAEARFSLALSYLIRLQSDKAGATFEEIARDPEGAPQIRHRAGVALAVLAEHRRLEAPLRQALESGEVGPFQAVLDDTPTRLLRRDDGTLDRFRRLASIFRDPPMDPGLLSRSGDSRAWGVFEATTLCPHAAGEANPGTPYRWLAAPQPGDDPAQEELLAAWRCVRDRAAFEAGQLQGAPGEAWLRYWHARLLSTAPEARPGQFKAVDAAIPGKPQIGPEFVTPLCRAVLGELSPTVPAGLARALFLYVSLKVLQPFVDGNSRLARFLMNAELESAGLPPVVIPASWIDPMNAGLDAVIFRGRPEPLLEALASANSDAAGRLPQIA